ncbi:MAG: SH3 domain-containing protein [Devosiaceae bacterium]|nr:SH3 domain-containing protein [Devosiaceae bacterium]
MNVRKTTLLGALAGIVIIASSASAFAAPATSKSALNVRSGPGTNYKVVDSLYRGERVNVGECVSNGWCYITHKGPDGWVSAKYLRAVTVREPRYSPPTRPRQNPSVNFGFSMNSNGGFTFGLGVGDRPYSPFYNPVAPTPPVNPKVCFYKGGNFTGAKYCVTPGTSDNMLPSNWNNRISSIKVKGGARVQVCRNRNFNGGCANIGSSKQYLGARFNNAITSFQAY